MGSPWIWVLAAGVAGLLIGTLAGAVLARRETLGKVRRLAGRLDAEKPVETQEDWGPLSELAEAIEAFVARTSASEQERERETNELIYGASHDLRSPLVTIQGFLQQFKTKYGEGLDEKASRYLSRISGAAGRMEMIVRDLVFFSRVCRPREEVQPARLGGLLAEAWMEAKKMTGREDAQVTFPPELPEIGCLPRTLVSAFLQVLHNSLTYVSAEKSPEIRITCEERPEGWLMVFQDNGIGIESDRMEGIFAPFKRLHGPDEYPGTGLGLAIVKRAIGQHGGSVRIESAVGKGTSVFLTIPALQPPPNGGGEREE